MDFTKQQAFAERMASRAPDAKPLTIRRTTPPADAEIDLQCTGMLKKGYNALNSGLHRNLGQYIAQRKLAQDRKGLLFFGDVGTGKTMWMRMFSGIRRIYTAKRLLDLYIRDRDEYDELICPKRYDQTPKRHYALVIDEIGSEGAQNNYGTKVDVIYDAISQRYDLFKRHAEYSVDVDDRYITHFTTNKTEAWLEKRYDTRIVSRLREMCTFVEFRGDDQRRLK